MPISSSYRLFLYICAVLFLINLLVMNDFAPLWEGAETLMLSNIENNTAYLLPVLKIKSVATILGDSLFAMRLVGVLLLLTTLTIFFFWGKKIFGEGTTLTALLVLGSSLLVVNLAKVATGDIWLFGVLSLNFITLILYLKQPVLKWKIAHWIFIALGAWIHPISALVFNMVLWTYLYFVHPQGKRLNTLLNWLIWLVLLPLIWYSDLLHFQFPIFYGSYGNISYGEYLLFSFGGFLPWIGFVLSGLWDNFQKLRKKEEFAIILIGGLLAGLLSHSLVVQMVLALIVAKQLAAYFIPNYPYKNIVKTGAVLQLIAAFGGITMLMIYSFQNWEAVGFRSAMAVGAMFWMPALVGVIGLLGNNNRFIRGGMALSGLAVVLFFWIQFFPLLKNG